MIISVAAEKAFENSTSFHDKNSQKIGIEETYFNIINTIYERPQLTLYSKVKS